MPLRPRTTNPGLCQGIPRSSANHICPWLWQWGVQGPVTALEVGLDPSLQRWPRPGHGLLPFYPQEHKQAARSQTTTLVPRDTVALGASSWLMGGRGEPREAVGAAHCHGQREPRPPGRLPPPRGLQHPHSLHFPLPDGAAGGQNLSHLRHDRVVVHAGHGDHLVAPAGRGGRA